MLTEFLLWWVEISGKFRLGTHVNTLIRYLFIQLTVSIYILMIQKISKIRARFALWLNEFALKMTFML